MSSPGDSGFRQIDDPLSKAAFDTAIAQHDVAIGSTVTELDAEIARLGRGSDIRVHPAARPSRPAMAKSGNARIAAYLGVKDEAEQLAWREALQSAGVNVSPVMDRTYFRSIYFQDPDGYWIEVNDDKF